MNENRKMLFPGLIAVILIASLALFNKQTPILPNVTFNNMYVVYPLTFVLSAFVFVKRTEPNSSEGKQPCQSQRCVSPAPKNLSAIMDPSIFTPVPSIVALGAKMEPCQGE